MHVQYDPSVDALYIRLAEGKYEESSEVQPDVILDKNKEGVVIGIELLSVSERIPNMKTSDFRYEVLEEKAS